MRTNDNIHHTEKTPDKLMPGALKNHQNEVISFTIYFWISVASTTLIMPSPFTSAAYTSSALLTSINLFPFSSVKLTTYFWISVASTTLIIPLLSTSPLSLIFVLMIAYLLKWSVSKHSNHCCILHSYLELFHLLSNIQLYSLFQLTELKL